MPTIGNNAAGAASSSRMPRSGAPIFFKIINVGYPVFSMKDPAKAWTPEKTTKATIDIAIYEGDTYDLSKPKFIARLCTVTASTKRPGELTVWPMETLVPGGAAGERIKVLEWDWDVAKAINDAVTNPNSEFNADPNDPCYLHDGIFAALHDVWYQEVGVSFPEAVTLYASKGWPGWLGGGGEEAAAVETEEPAASESVAVVPAEAPVAQQTTLGEAVKEKAGVGGKTTIKAPQRPAAAPASVAEGDPEDPFAQ